MTLKSETNACCNIPKLSAARVDAATRLQGVAHAAGSVSGGQSQFVPAEGWIATVRKALRMSGAELARRLGVTRARVSEMEKTETHGSVTLRSMDAAAKAMGCRFVYAIVPDGNVQVVIEAQAHRKAQAIVNRASDHILR